MTASPSPLPVLPDPRLATGVQRLARRWAGHYGADTIRELVADSYQRLAGSARVRGHLVALAERLTAERLDALAHSETAPAHRPPRVLFVCSHNAGRSQLAAALLTLRAGGRVTVSSAGTHPAAEVEPEVARLLAEAGLPPGDAYPKPLTDEILRAADIVVTMGCGDACPVIPGPRYLDWPVADPDGAPAETVRAIRDEIDAHITGLLATLAPAGPGA
ncbi:low molecular weight phosphatase family protein [Streptomyces aidingensis]|uniref:Protein-tyrosine-phosphatase n=1 Tax=Streptomyces aidingensis TaxID=910347 RepID=A0A1I1N7J0_9ACTN|nr:phosphatase [Streptomyces aidingensis]SFC93326.1 Protein-tyrosine-phosphatase [Streptomyces aidingensis]